MPITLDQVQLEYKSLPLTLHEDGSCTVTLRKGYFKDGVFNIVAMENYFANKEETSAILDVQGISQLTRRDDLSLAIYQFCVSKGAEAGVIT
jgi:hypothetical protein